MPDISANAARCTICLKVQQVVAPECLLCGAETDPVYVGPEGPAGCWDDTVQQYVVPVA